MMYKYKIFIFFHYSLFSTLRAIGRFLVLLFSFMGSTGCDDVPRSPRVVRGHDVNIDGIAHGLGFEHAERYCKGCHGLSLIGGSNLEPSCYTCHGKNWLDSSGEEIHAPLNHTVPLNDWFHDPGYKDPTTYCSSCHGANLEGDQSLDIPSCHLCHEQVW